MKSIELLPFRFTICRENSLSLYAVTDGFLTTFLTTFLGAALPLGAAAAFGVDFLPPPNMAGSAERTAVRVTTAEAGATNASVWLRGSER